MMPFSHTNTVYTLPPRLDALNSPATGAAMARRIAGRRTTLALDAGDLSYISSKGVHTLRRLRQDLQASGGSLKILRPTGFAREVMIYGGLGDSLAPDEGGPLGR